MSLYLVPSFIFGICIPDSSNWDSLINSALPSIALLRSSSYYLLVSDLTDPPSIHLNSKYLPNQAEAVLTTGTPFTLRCTGASSVHWSSSAFRLLYRGRLVDPIDVQRADPRHTGTYRCGYTNQSLEHLSSWIHLYVKGNIRWSHILNLEVITNLQKTHRSFAASLTDPADPSTVFVTPRNSPNVKEGQDFLYRCLLTDPSVTNLTFQPEDNIQGSGQHLPVGMNVTVDPKRGALIQDVQRSFSGQYVCSGWKDGRHFKSKSFYLLVAPSKTCHFLFWPVCLLASLFADLCIIVVLIEYPLSSYADNLTKAVEELITRRLCIHHLVYHPLTCLSVHLSNCPSGLPPPSVAIHQTKAVRLEGEKFEVTCVSSSPTHLFNVTWTHLTKKVRCPIWCRGRICQRSPVNFSSCFSVVCLIQNFNVAVTREYHNSHLYISSTLMIAAVSQEDRGTYTCAAASEDGVTTATTHLIVLGECISDDTFFVFRHCS